MAETPKAPRARATKKTAVKKETDNRKRERSNIHATASVKSDSKANQSAALTAHAISDRQKRRTVRSHTDMHGKRRGIEAWRKEE